MKFFNLKLTLCDKTSRTLKIIATCIMYGTVSYGMLCPDKNFENKFDFYLQAQSSSKFIKKLDKEKIVICRTPVYIIRKKNLFKDIFGVSSSLIFPSNL